MGWDYSGLSHTASTYGGPALYEKHLRTEGYNERVSEERNAAGVAGAVALGIGATWVFYHASEIRECFRLCKGKISKKRKELTSKKEATANEECLQSTKITTEDEDEQAKGENDNV